MQRNRWIYIVVFLTFICCKKEGANESTQQPSAPASYNFDALKVNGSFNGFDYVNVNFSPVIKLSFSTIINRNAVHANISFRDNNGTAILYTATYENADSTIVIAPSSPLLPITKYTIDVSKTLQAKAGGNLQSAVAVTLRTQIDSTDKFPRISDDQLLDKVQRQTFKYFWEFAHPASGLARERNTSENVVTTGGSGFGIMAMVAAVHRNFITRADALARMQKMVDFLKNKADRFHGAFPHWLDGNTGKVIPFSEKDNGADLVETSYLMEGLLTARQFFDAGDIAETSLRDDINTLGKAVEWSWFTKNNEKVLYWHWSPNYQFEMNQPIKGWNEALITYALAASSPTYPIAKDVYDQGWASNGGMKNGNSYYSIQLPLGPPNGGPMFFAHYSFLGINPKGLTDAYANYETQNKAHTLINYNYCRQNPKNFYGYSDSCWGLTASDDNKSGYLAHEPNNDDGVISPTAALSSMPYAPAESMRALNFFYYKLGDKIFKDYGFVDAFSLNDIWFADTYLAIEQGPIIVMIENYRSGLLWNLFMSCPEVKAGMHNLGFTSPNL